MVSSKPGRAAPAALLLLVLALLLAGCAAAPVFGGRPRYHQVRPGETLWRIARYYRVSVEDIKRANNLTDNRLEVGRVLTIPGAAPTPAAAREAERRPRRDAGKWIWPVGGSDPIRVASFFGPRRGSFHTGLDISGEPGEAILAARDGVVIFNAFRKDYGWTLILQHRGRYNSLYAHNRINLVALGDKVGAGQVIARLGSSGRSTGPHLHLEVRYRGQPIDPLSVLPELD